jgi:hypothetical protein
VMVRTGVAASVRARARVEARVEVRVSARVRARVGVASREAAEVAHANCGVGVELPPVAPG